jgi:hypothetical protein
VAPFLLTILNITLLPEWVSSIKSSPGSCSSPSVRPVGAKPCPSPASPTSGTVSCERMDCSLTCWGRTEPDHRNYLHLSISPSTRLVGILMLPLLLPICCINPAQVPSNSSPIPTTCLGPPPQSLPLYHCHTLSSLQSVSCCCCWSWFYSTHTMCISPLLPFIRIILPFSCHATFIQNEFPVTKNFRESFQLLLLSKLLQTFVAYH